MKSKLESHSFRVPKSISLMGNFTNVNIRCMGEDHKSILRIKYNIHTMGHYSHDNTDESQMIFAK